MLLNFLLLSIVISALDFFGAPSTMVAICVGNVILHLLLVHRQIIHSGASLNCRFSYFSHHQIVNIISLCLTSENQNKVLKVFFFQYLIYTLEVYSLPFSLVLQYPFFVFAAPFFSAAHIFLYYSTYNAFYSTLNIQFTSLYSLAWYTLFLFS